MPPLHSDPWVTSTVIDLAVTRSVEEDGSGWVGILHDHGNGTFGPENTIRLDEGSEGVVIDDFDGDALVTLLDARATVHRLMNQDGIAHP